MKSKMKKKMIAFLLCMVLVICNSVSILADTPAAETTTTEKQAKETRTAKSEGTSEEEKSSDNSKDTSKTSEETEETKEEAPETKTTEKKEETTGATTEKKEEPTTATTTEKKEETEESSETSEKKETEEAEETATTGSEEETSEASEETSESEEETSTEETGETTQSPAYDGKYEDSKVTISVSAEAGIVPEGAELSVTPIEKTEITDDMSEEDKAKAEEINAQYDLTEKKLTEDSEANEETMEGFLAYDISFIVDGKEVEPNGDVKVVMDFKEAAAPEGVSEDATVAVKHLKEVESAAGGVVVEDMAEKATIETTEKAEVEKVKLAADNFSIYVIQWENGREISINVVDDKGNSIGNNESTVPLESNESTVEEIAKKIAIPAGYEFKEARTGGNDFDEADVVIKKLQHNKKNNQYQIEYSNEWEKITSNIYFVYVKLPGIVTTADTSDFIQLNLFDYVVGSANTNPPYNEYNQQANNRVGDNTGINAGHALKFQTNSGGWDSNSINISGTPNRNIVLPTLKNGFPQLNPEKKDSDGKSLGYLFNSESTDYKSVHTNLNHLFQYDSDTRQYSYNSNENYAYLDAQNGATDFIVYNTYATITNKENSTKGFFPFSKYSAVNGSERGYKNGVTLDCNDRQNHYFGMSMSTQFMQPKDGMITGSDEMIFSFSGDDDVWVYIDGVLVMDIGGSHGEIAGTINFTTGEVTVGGETQGYIGDLLRENGVSESKLNIGQNSKGETVNTLKDYEEFDLDFFYLERGNWDSNCKLEFNLAMINKNSVSVGKQITDVDTSNYKNIQFEYLIEIGEDETNLNPYENKKYKIYNLDDRSYTGQTGTTDANGHFYLKHNQMAVFEEDSSAGTQGIDENLFYKVTELNVNSQEYNDVRVNQTNIVSEKYDETISDDGTISGNSTNDKYDAESPIYKVNETGQVIFYNRCSAYNKRELHITKQIKAGQASSEAFDIMVRLGDAVYEGKYILISANGTKESKEAENGIITLKIDEEAVISEIPADTNFEIIEQELPPEYKSPQYQVTNGGDSPETDGKATGQTVLGKDTEVVVTNSYTAPDALFIEVQKTFSGLDGFGEEWNSLKQNFKIKIYDSTGEDLLKTLTLNDSDCEVNGNTYSWRIEIASTDIDGDTLTYQIQEEGATVEGYELTVTVNGTPIESIQKVPVHITNPTFTIRGSDFKEENQCSTTVFDFDTNFIAARIERNAEFDYFVWTENELSIMEREALIKMIIGKAGNDWNDMKVSSTLFYSDEGDNSIKEGIEVAGNIVKLEDRTLTFSATNQWQKVCGGFYEKTAGQDAEVAVTNGYKPETVDIDIIKYGSNYDETNKQEGAMFKLYQGNMNEKDKLQWQAEPLTGFESISASANGNPELSLSSGYYKLVETKAPAGYQLLSDEIYFKIENGTVNLVDSSGTIIENTDNNRMWELDNTGTTITLKIKNEILYSLPSAGGPGIYWYTLSGTLLMAGAALIVYRQKRKREVLLRK